VPPVALSTPVGAPNASTGHSSGRVMATNRVHFTEEQSTNLATLYGRALDSRLAEPIFGDTTAEDAVRRIDYDFGKFRMNRDHAVAIAARAKIFDDWTRQFLHERPATTVLHLGCGLDSRVYRLDPTPIVQWFDVDYPNVIELRKTIYPQHNGYRMIGSSVTNLGWLSEVPRNLPTLMVAEGLTMYLAPEDGESLLREIVESFPSGEMMFDCYSKIGIKLQKANPMVRRAGATLHWGIDDPHELEKLGLTLVEQRNATDFATSELLSKMSWKVRLQLKLAAAIPMLRNMGQVLRYRF
jgi:O-methyltransferase involved in polyketide biosynthesis